MTTNKEKGFLEQAPEPKVTAKPSGFEASSKEAKPKSLATIGHSRSKRLVFPGPAHNPAYVHDNGNEKEEEQARYLEKETFRLKEIVNVMGNSLFKFLHFGVEND